MSDLETALRHTLSDAERTAPAPHDLAERLIATTLTPRRGAPHVVTLHGRRAARRWLPPLLAAAVIIAIVTAGVIARSAVSSEKHRPIHLPVPQVPFPKTFSVSDVYFRGAQTGWALGDGCDDPARACVALLHTHDGGATWQAMPAPPVEIPTGGCRQSGDNVAGAGAAACVDQVVFADDLHGYAWGYHAFFWTNDGGRTWQRDSSRPQSVVIAGSNVLRTVASGLATGPTILQVQAIGATGWATVTPGGGGAAETSQILASGKVAYYLASHYPTGGVLFRSQDSGETWTQVNDAPCGTTLQTTYVRLAPDGSLAALCYGGANATIRISTDGGHAFGPGIIAPGTHKTDQAQLIPDILPVSPKVLLEYVGVTGGGHAYRRTTDGGLTWRVVGHDSALESIFLWQMFDAKNGYRLNESAAVGSRSGLLFTHDGGATWTPRPFSS